MNQPLSRTPARSPGAGGPISILHCIATLAGGGAEHQLKSIAGLLVNRGFAISIFSRFLERDRKMLEAAGVNCLQIHSHPDNAVALAAEFYRATRQVAPTVVQTWLTQMDLLGGFLAPRGAARILSERASELGYPRTPKNIVRRYVGLRADMIVANSSMGARYWQSAARVAVVPNGVDIECMRRVPGGYYSDDPRFAGRRIIVSVGRLSAQKQMQTLIGAIDLVRRSAPDILLVLLGEGEDRPALERMVAERELHGHVLLPGFVDDAPRWLKSAHLFAMSSIFEGQPNAALEAAAAQVPMILSDIPEHRDLFDGAAAFAPVGDEEAFAQGIDGLLGDPSRRRALTEAAADRVAARSFERVADAYAALYCEVAQTSVRPA